LRSFKFIYITVILYVPENLYEVELIPKNVIDKLKGNLKFLKVGINKTFNSSKVVYDIDNI